MTNLHNRLNDADKQLLQEIASLETAMNSADNALIADYTNKIAALEQRLSNEGTALQAEINNLQKSYQTADLQLKENLELQQERRELLMQNLPTRFSDAAL